MPNASQQSTAITDYRQMVDTLLKIAPNGVEKIKRLVYLGILKSDGTKFVPGDAIIAPIPAVPGVAAIPAIPPNEQLGTLGTDAVEGVAAVPAQPGTFQGDNDHLDAQALADSANVLMTVATTIMADDVASKLAIIPR